MKAVLVILIICSFIVTQNTQGVFQQAVGDKVAYKIVEAYHDIAVESTTAKFIGCSNNGTIIAEESTIVAEVIEVTTTDLTWNTTKIKPEMTGKCHSLFFPSIYYNYLSKAYVFLGYKLDFPTIIGTGVIEPIYFEPFELPLFVDPKPQTWLDFVDIEFNFEASMIAGLAGWDTVYVDVTHSEVNNNMTISLVLSATWVQDASNSYTLIALSSFSYDMISGKLLAAKNNFNTHGVVTDASFATSSHYNIKQTDVPVALMWYFIGGAGGLVVIGATVGIILGVKKSKTAKKGAKKKSSKKKK